MKDFAQLFQGRSDSFGVYRVLEVIEGKQKGQGTTYPNKRFPERVLEPSDWDKHLSGDQMLGIVPVLPDGTCCWFALDVDDYSVSHHKLVVDIEKHELPLVVCRSKSGGAHLYCFTSEFIPAKLAVSLLEKWAIELDLKKYEVFPKQTKFDNDQAKGNWIIIPYFGGNKANDFGISVEGEKLTVEDFVQWANAKMISLDEAKSYTKRKQKSISEMSEEELLSHSPPCIQKIFEAGIARGSGRNNFFSHLCFYYKLIDKHLNTEDWQERLSAANQKYCTPPMKVPELHQIMMNHSGPKSYKYQCDNIPQKNFCDRETCLKRKLGIGEDKSYYDELEITSMIKIDSKPPIWIPKINGTDIEMDTDTLLSPRKFRHAVADGLNVLIAVVKQSSHDDLIGPIMKGALTIEPMEEMTAEGKVNICFQEWTKNMVIKSRSMQDLEKGLPYFNKDENTIYFRGGDFIKEYRRTYKDNTTDRQIWLALRNMGFKRKQYRIHKEPEWVWYYTIYDESPWFETDTGEQF